MKRPLMAALLTALPVFAPITAHAGNSEPIILVHGFVGWGPNEMYGYKYWGGLNDVASALTTVRPSWCTSNDCQIMTAVVGPVSSNWDRAVELFYQIKGGCVNYGHHHSTTIKRLDSSTGLPINSAPYLSHVQTLDGQNGAPSKCYTGLYPQWDANHKIHLIGHSMGGQTIRLLNNLLRYGSPADVAEEPALNDESLQANPFTGGKYWLHSMTTVATPHNGTTLASLVQLAQVAQQAVAAVATAANISGANMIYDFKLDQWNLTRLTGESWDSYSSRVYNSSVWTNNTDISAWDLSPDGAKVQNDSDSIDPNTYYYSIGTQQTYKETWWPFYAWHPYGWLTSIFQPQADAMGHYTRNQAGHVVINDSWFQNDGVVNTISTRAPTTGTTAQPSVNFNWNGAPVKGTWQYMGTWDWDHMDMVGNLCENNDWAHCDPRQTYKDQAVRLWNLN